MSTASPVARAAPIPAAQASGRPESSGACGRAGQVLPPPAFSRPDHRPSEDEGRARQALAAAGCDLGWVTHSPSSRGTLGRLHPPTGAVGSASSPPTSTGRALCGSGLPWESLPGGDEGASGHALLLQPGQSLQHLLLSRLPYSPRHNSSTLTISTMQFTFFRSFLKAPGFSTRPSCSSPAQSLLQHPSHLRELLLVFLQWYLGPGTAIPWKMKLPPAPFPAGTWQR